MLGDRGGGREGPHEAGCASPPPVEKSGAVFRIQASAWSRSESRTRLRRRCGGRTTIRWALAYDEMFAPDGRDAVPLPAAAGPHSPPWAPRSWPSASRRWSARSCCRASPSPSTAPTSATERIIPTDLFPRIIPGRRMGQDRGGPDPAAAGAEPLPRRHLRRAEDPDGRRRAARPGAGRARPIAARCSTSTCRTTPTSTSAAAT